MRPHEEDVPGASAKHCARKPAMILPAPQAVVAKKSNEPHPCCRPRTYEENDDHPRKNKHPDDESKYHRKRYRDDDEDDRKGDQHDEKHRRKKADKDDKKKGKTKVDEKKKERGDEKTRKKKDDRDDMRQIHTKEKKQRDDDKAPTLIQVPQAGGTATTAHATLSARKASTLADDLSRPVQRKTKELASLEEEKKAMDTEIETIPGKMQMYEEEINERRTTILALKVRAKDFQKQVEEKASEIIKKKKELLELKNYHAKAVVDNQKLEEQKKLLEATHLKKVSEETPSASASDSSDKEYSYLSDSQYSEETEEGARKKRV